MKKKSYQKPTMKVVILQQRTMLLAGSGLNDPDDYNYGGDPLNQSDPELDVQNLMTSEP